MAHRGTLSSVDPDVPVAVLIVMPFCHNGSDDDAPARTEVLAGARPAGRAGSDG